jgi:hypothetical protein
MTHPKGGHHSMLSPIFNLKPSMNKYKIHHSIKSKSINLIVASVTLFMIQLQKSLTLEIS